MIDKVKIVIRCQQNFEGLAISMKLLQIHKVAESYTVGATADFALENACTV